MKIKIPAYRYNDFCEEVFGQSLDMYDLRLFDFGRLVEQECIKLFNEKLKEKKES